MSDVTLNTASGAITLTAANSSGNKTLTLPAVSDTLVGKATTDTLTNKTLTSPVIATIVNTGTLTLPTSTDTLVGKATTDTLTNKSIEATQLTGTIAAARLPAGSVLQVVQSTQTATTTYSVARTWTSMSSFLSASITPTSSSSKILILVQIGKVHNINGVIIRLTRGGSVISGAVGNSAGARPSATTANISGFNGDNNHSDGVNMSFLDSPSTTSSTAYSFDAYSEYASITTFNRSIADADNTEEYSARVMSSIILMEISA